MKAKKVLSVALLLALSTAMLITPVSANEVDDYGTVETIEISSQAVELKELKGSIKEIREMELVVEDADGKEYIVPIFGFKQLEEYQAADLQVGDEIELKGHGSQMMAGLSIAARELKDGETVLELRKAEGGNLPEIAISWEAEEKATELKDRLTTISAVRAMRIENLSEEDIEKLKQSPSTDIIKEDDAAAGTRVKIFNGNIETFEVVGDQELGFTLNISDLTGDIEKAMASGELFIANEITVRGVTLKLENMVESRAAIKVIK